MFKNPGRYFFLFTGLLVLLAMPFQVYAQDKGSETSDAEALKKRLEAVTAVPDQNDLVKKGEAGVILQGVTKQCWLAGTCSVCDMLVVVVNVSNSILRVFAIVGVMMLLYGAAWMTLSSGNANAVERGKNIMKAAIIGGVIVLGSWQFMNIIVTTLYNTSARARTDTGAEVVSYNPVTSWFTVVSSCRKGVAPKKQ